MANGLGRRPHLRSRKPAPQGAMRDALEQMAQEKLALRGELHSAGATAQRPAPLVSTPSGNANALKVFALQRKQSRTRANGPLVPRAPMTGGADRVRDVQSSSTYDAVRQLNIFTSRADIAMPLEALRPLMDPRAWDQGPGVVDTVFRVYLDDNGDYQPLEEDPEAELGTAWKPSGAGPHLLYEYARTDAASFENVLEITRFDPRDTVIKTDYRLYDCLKCTIGLLSFDGGLQINEGFVEATALDDGWSRIRMEKRVRVRDLTPSDPGNGFDFGEWINTTIGIALTLWVDDTAMLTPIS